MSTQSCLTLCNPMDCSPPDCSVPGIFQARILEKVAISFSRGSSQLPRDQKLCGQEQKDTSSVFLPSTLSLGRFEMASTKPEGQVVVSAACLVSPAHGMLSKATLVALWAAVFVAERQWDPNPRISGSPCLNFLQESLLVCENTSEGQSVIADGPSHRWRENPPPDSSHPLPSLFIYRTRSNFNFY